MELFEYGEKDASIVLLQPVDDHDLSLIENECRLIAGLTERDFSLLALRIADWNRDLSPWKAPAVFGKEEFGGGAADTLKEIMDICNDRSRTWCIGGYSLAGLFALWACYNSDCFAGTASASASLWFPGFAEYMKTKELHSDHIYLSLGDREEKTRNPIMAAVGDRTREAYAALKEQGKDCILEWNEGNHFKDADQRTAKAFAWVINRL